MALTYNDANDIYRPDGHAKPFESGPRGQRFREMTPDEKSAAAERLYGNQGPHGMTLSVAETYAAQLFDGTRMRAQVDGHFADFPVIESEARALANFAHQNLSQSELEQLVRTMGPFMKSLTDVGDESANAQAAYTGQKDLAKKFGLVGGGDVYRAAQPAIAKLAAAGLRRALIDHAGQHNPDVMEHLALLAYAKRWATKPTRPSLSFEPPAAA